MADHRRVRARVIDGGRAVIVELPRRGHVVPAQIRIGDRDIDRVVRVRVGSGHHPWIGRAAIELADRTLWLTQRCVGERVVGRRTVDHRRIVTAAGGKQKNCVLHSGVSSQVSAQPRGQSSLLPPYTTPSSRWVGDAAPRTGWVVDANNHNPSCRVSVTGSWRCMRSSLRSRHRSLRTSIRRCRWSRATTYCR